MWKPGAFIAAALIAGLAVLATPSTVVRAATADSGPYLSPAMTGTEWSSLPTSDPVVALTFDAGANADGVPSILSTLQQYGVPATFFLTGTWVQNYPGIAAQIAASPAYAIGNHTYDHPDLTTLADAQVRAEVAQAQSAIASATGRDTHPLFRFPFGARDARTIGIVNSMGYGNIRWTVDTLGWKGTSEGQSVDSVVSRVMSEASAGEIVLMHVGSNPDDHSTLDANALPTVIQRLQASGFGFVNLAQAVKTLRVDAFGRGNDGAVWHRWWDGQRWAPWESLGGLTPDASSPASASWGYNRLDVFVRGIDDQLWHRAWDGSAWSAWEPLGGILTSAPAVVARAPNRLDVFVRGVGDGLWVRSWDGGRWTDWYLLGGILTSAPAASGAGPAMDVFVRGQDSALWAISWVQTSGFTAWRSLGGILTSAPAAALAGSTTHVFARGLDNGLWHRAGNAPSWQWSGWEPLGGYLTSAPAADSRSATTIDVFVRGGDSALWARWGTGTWWSAWGSLGGVLRSGPSSAS